MKKIVFLLIVFLLFSCGARKTSIQKEEIKVEQTTKATEEVLQVSEIIESSVDTTSIIEEMFEPIDSSKPMVIDKKNGIFKNTRFKATKTKKNIHISKKEESSLNQTKETLNEVSMDVETKDKESDKKETFGVWIWLLIILGIILGYLEFRKR